MNKRIGTHRLGLYIAQRATAALIAAATASTSMAQTATNNCGYNAGNQYPVGTSCSLTAFDKPDSFTNFMTPAGSTCSSGNYDDAWGWFTATGTTTNITYDPDNNHRAIVHVFSGACGSLSQVACVDAGSNGTNADLTFATTIGTNYMIRVQRRNTDNGMDGRICIWSVPPPPSNDDPCGATALTLGSTCTLTSRTTIGATATAGVPAPGCGGYSGADVWYSFVAPSSALVTLRTTAGSLSNVGMAVYSANACNGTFTLITCDNSSGPGNMPFITLTPLEIVAGQTYYVRMWANGGGTGNFNLCANTAATGSSCVYVLRMYDSQGDGWGGSNVSIQVGGGAAVSYTIATGDQETAYINVNTGQVVQLTYNAVGGGQSEISYILQLMYGPLYQDGPSPGTGLRYAATASCQSPPASTSDCYGRTEVCGAQLINDNPTNTGLTADLNNYNRGCLGSNERQGTWYSFTPSSGGTLGFTIAPNNSSDDYDFAVWGPFTTLSCPPLNSPLRCNYSGTTGNTGLSSSGTNDSEPSWGSKWSNLMTVTTGQHYLLYISNWSRSGLAFSLSWQLTNGASLDCLLPIELASLYGAPVPEGIRLDWVTASESNSSSFAIERMEPDGSFAQIGEMPAAGWSSSILNYSFIDAQPLPGFNTYRLKLIDMDGTTKLSDVVAVMNRYGAMHHTPFPNPASDEISIDIDASAEGIARLSILDASGRLVKEMTMSVSDGPQRLSIPLGGLEAGHYLLSARIPGIDGSAPARFAIQ